jgi:DnaK suppressor protein
MEKGFEDRRMEHLRRRLLERKRQVWQDVAVRLREELGEEYQSQLGLALDDPEKALVDLMGDTDMILLENRRDELEAIEEALNRIEEGFYGICADCGQRIPARRLKALPFAVRCVEDQARVEGRFGRASL